MKRKNVTRSSSLFLLELILAILLFSITSAVCVRLFAHSHIMSQEAHRMNRAVNECSGIAEIADASNGVQDALDILTTEYPQAETDTQNGTATVRICYDSEFSPCAKQDEEYILLAELTEENRMLNAVISMHEADTENPSADSPDRIYGLTVKHYLQRGTGDE